MHLLAFKNFLRSKTVIAGFILVLATGLVSIFIGKQFLAKQEKAVEAVTRFQHDHIERNVHYFNKEMGLLLYYLRFAFINKPDKLAAVSVGQRDVNPSIQAVTIRGLEAQKYDTDLTNPANLLSGNLDLGFVIIYLFPLLIISSTFNLLSEEKESGTWPLVAVQSRSPLRFLLQKLAVRAVVVYGLLATLLLAAAVVLSIPVNAPFLLLCAVATLYILFWFGLSFFIASLDKSSPFNALLLLAIWVTLTILLPASVNNYVAGKYPVPEALNTMVKQRDGYHKKWDEDQEETVQKFYAHYPQYKKYPLTDRSFNWLWYYAAQQMGDDESAGEATEMKKKLTARERSSNSIAAFIPTMHTQLQFNAIAGSGMMNHLGFLDSTTAFHERLRLHFYPKIFEEAPVADEKWKNFTPQYFTTAGEINWGKALLPLFVAIILVWLAGWLSIKKRV